MGGSRRYNVEFAFLNAAEFGVPQNRQRLFIVAMEAGRVWDWPQPTSRLGDLTLWDAIGDLPPEIGPSGVMDIYEAQRTVSTYAQRLGGGNGPVLNHHTKRLEHFRLQRLDALQEGQDRRHLPPHLQAGGHETKYRRLRANAASPTVTAHMGKDLSDFIHPRLPRTLTVREAARIQGFPDAYEFLGSQASQLTQVGNAVPVPLAYTLGFSIARTLAGFRTST